MLDFKVRGALEQVIDQFVSSFPTAVSSLREGTRKTDLHLENENDYALGYAHGMITASFLATFMMLTNRHLTPRRKRKLTRLSIIERMSSETPYLRVDNKLFSF
jgi:hypothetical protein